ncbi:MAG: hypothetical protein ACLU5J_10350 [Christensenellales bacterium]
MEQLAKGMLDLMGAIYSASDVIPSAIVQDKVATKALLDKFMLPNIASSSVV